MARVRNTCCPLRQLVRYFEQRAELRTTNGDRKIGFSQERVNGTDQFSSADIELHVQRAIVVVQSLPQRGRDRRRIPFLGAAQEPGGVDLRAVGEDGEACQAEVDADAPVGVGDAGGVGVRAASRSSGCRTGSPGVVPVRLGRRRSGRPTSSRSICRGCPGRKRPGGRTGGAGPRWSLCSPPVGCRRRGRCVRRPPRQMSCASG